MIMATYNGFHTVLACGLIMFCVRLLPVVCEDRLRASSIFDGSLDDYGDPPATSTILLYDCSSSHRASPDDSSQFQVYHNSQWWTQACQEGLQWNQSLCRCEYPEGKRPPVECRDYRPSRSDKTAGYEQRVNGQWIQRDCSLAVAGLVWDQAACQCVWGPDSKGKVTGQAITPCDVMLNMTFEDGIKDSAKGSFVEIGRGIPVPSYIVRGEPRNRAGFFTNTALNIWFFAGNELGTSLRVEFRFKITNDPSTKNTYQIMLSNGCNVSEPGYTTPSLAIGYRPADQSYLLAFETASARKAIVCSKKLGAYDWHDVSLIYEDGTLLLRIDGFPCIISQDFTGPVQKTACPLTIGADPLERQSMYNGYLDEVVIARYCRRFIDQDLPGRDVLDLGPMPVEAAAAMSRSGHLISGFNSDTRRHKHQENQNDYENTDEDISEYDTLDNAEEPMQNDLYEDGDDKENAWQGEPEMLSVGVNDRENLNNMERPRNNILIDTHQKRTSTEKTRFGQNIRSARKNQRYSSNRQKKNQGEYLSSRKYEVVTDNNLNQRELESFDGYGEIQASHRVNRQREMNDEYDSLLDLRNNDQGLEVINDNGNRYSFETELPEISSPRLWRHAKVNLKRYPRTKPRIQSFTQMLSEPYLSNRYKSANDASRQKPKLNIYRKHARNIFKINNKIKKSGNTKWYDKKEQVNQNNDIHEKEIEDNINFDANSFSYKEEDTANSKTIDQEREKVNTLKEKTSESLDANHNAKNKLSDQKILSNTENKLDTSVDIEDVSPSLETDTVLPYGEDYLNYYEDDLFRVDPSVYELLTYDEDQTDLQASSFENPVIEIKSLPAILKQTPEIDHDSKNENVKQNKQQYKTTSIISENKNEFKKSKETFYDLEPEEFEKIQKIRKQILPYDGSVYEKSFLNVKTNARRDELN